MAEFANNPYGFKEAVTIQAERIFDSCSDRDCLEDLEVVFPDFESNQLVNETGGIIPKDGKIVSENGEIDPESQVSMNFWGFSHETLPAMERYFEDFLRKIKPEEIKAECLLPIMVNDMLAAGSLEVLAEPSSDRWFGITYKEDKPDTERELLKLHASGAYPAKVLG